MTSLNLKDVQAYLEVRGSIYDIFRRVFFEEPKEKLLQIFDKDFLENFPFEDDEGYIADGIKLVTNSKTSYDSEQLIEILHGEYTRLFIGPEDLPAPLWESAYMNDEKLLFQIETLLVRRAYLKYRLLPTNYGVEADDHLSLELDYMFRLNDLLLDAIEQRDIMKINDLVQDQEKFLTNHLLNWIPMLKEKIFQHSKHDFYKGMISILYGFLQVDKLSLQELQSIEELGNIEAV